jgi:hypothetical protein
LRKGPDRRGPLFSECDRERGERLEWAGGVLWAGRGNGPRRGRLGRSGEKEGVRKMGRRRVWARRKRSGLRLKWEKGKGLGLEFFFPKPFQTFFKLLNFQNFTHQNINNATKINTTHIHIYLICKNYQLIFSYTL